MAKLHDYYRDQVVSELKNKFMLQIYHTSPKIEKITLNMNVGEALTDKKLLDNAVADLATISSQKPLVSEVENMLPTLKSVRNIQ